MSEERLQKILSRAGIASRRAAEKLILEGRVKVNDEIITELGTKIDPSECTIKVDGRKITLEEQKIYLILNKPKGILSTAKDDRGRKTVIDLIEDVDERIYPVGRLDFNTEGLILLTNDGDLMNALLHPKFQIKKTYLARVSGKINERKLDKLRMGIRLEDGMTAPAEVYLIQSDENSAEVELTIHEGRNRQVRRMFAAIGCDVKKLKRIHFADLTVEGLKAGHYRHLTKLEIEKLYKMTGLKT